MNVTGALWITGAIAAAPAIVSLIAWGVLSADSSNVNPLWKFAMWMFFAFFFAMLLLFILATWSAVV